jgi:hypothetical protein
LLDATKESQPIEITQIFSGVTLRGDEVAKSPEDVALKLINIYRHGFERRGSYRISKPHLRELFGMARVEATTLKTLHDVLREDGYLLTPLDQDDYHHAQTWIVQRLVRLERQPIVDDAVIAEGAGEDEVEN